MSAAAPIWARYKWATGHRVHYWRPIPGHKWMRSRCGDVVASAGQLEPADLPRCQRCKQQRRKVSG